MAGVSAREAVDFRESAGEDPADGGSWGAERTVRAQVLRALLLDGPRQDGGDTVAQSGGGPDHRPARSSVRDDRPPRCGCGTATSKRPRGATPPGCGNSNLSESVLPGLVAHAVHVDGVLRLTRTRCTGAVRLGGARIAGSLYLESAEVAAPGTDEPVLQLNQAALDADLWAPGLRTQGQIRLHGATVAGSVEPERGAAQPPRTGRARRGRRSPSRATCWSGTPRCAARWGCAAPVSRGGSTCRTPSWRIREGSALRASSTTIGELWLRKGPPMEGGLNLRRAQLDVLFLEPESAPGEVLLNHLTYGSSSRTNRPSAGCPLLERDRDGYVPHAYE